MEKKGIYICIYEYNRESKIVKERNLFYYNISVKKCEELNKTERNYVHVWVKRNP